MDYQRFRQQCRDYIALMEQGEGMIARGDVDAIESMAMDAAHLLVDMRAAWNELEQQAYMPGAVLESSLAELRYLMREALCRVERNKDNVAAWKAQTQASLCTARAASVAMAGYASVALRPRSSVHTRG
ncbi:MAG: hypothetical protein KGO52_00290 [Nitrospirota bacterium]|nr:hypothetical protein [Nitrospirota bacterium]